MEVLCFGLEASTFAVTRAHLFELVVLLSRHPLQFQGRVQSFAMPLSVAPWRANIAVRLLSALHVMRSGFPGNANRFPCIHLPRIPRLCAQQPCRRQVRSSAFKSLGNPTTLPSSCRHVTGQARCRKFLPLVNDPVFHRCAGGEVL